MATRSFDELPVVSMRLIAEGGNATASDARVIHFMPPADPSESQALRLIEKSGALDFWADDAENGYAADDGEPI